MSQQIAASVYMITLNEENNVAESLASVADFAEVIIVDSGSTDRTLAIAEGSPTFAFSTMTGQDLVSRRPMQCHSAASRGYSI